MSYTELATKYRPRKFTQVIGQPEKFLLQELVKTPDQFPPLLIFCGPSGVGKTTLARIVAAALNCDNVAENGDPCASCDSCQLVKDDAHPNVEELDAATNGSVDKLRELRDKAMLHSSGTKVFIIDEAQSISPQGWNSLLKLFEEPPVNTAFILLTSEPRKVPTKIRTRGIRFNMRMVAPNELQDYLSKLAQFLNVQIDNDDISVIVDCSEGSVRDALVMMGQCLTAKKPANELFEVNDLSYEVVNALIKRDNTTMYETMDRWWGLTNDAQTILGQLAVTLEKTLFVRHKVPVFAGTKSSGYLRSFASALDDAAVSALLEHISDWMNRTYTKGQLVVFSAAMVKLLNGPTSVQAVQATTKPKAEEPLSVEDIQKQLKYAKQV